MSHGTRVRHPYVGLVPMNNRTPQTNGNHQNSRVGMQHAFHRFACKTAEIMGSPWVFLLAVLVIVVWGFLGPIFRYSDSWQLVINTATTIITFLMVFLIQNTQNRDAKAFHLKLDELIHAMKGARNKMINPENMTDEELEALKKEFEKISGRREEQAETGHRQKEPVAE